MPQQTAFLRLQSPDEFLDQPHVGQRVHFPDQARRLSLFGVLDLAINQGCEALTYAIYDYISQHSDASRAAEAEDLAADVRFRDDAAEKEDE